MPLILKSDVERTKCLISSIENEESEHIVFFVLLSAKDRKENVVALQRAEMRMVRWTWMCGVKLKDRLPIKELRERLSVDDIALVLQQNRLRW